jgi:sugar phosphate isomerase/epimerase
MKKFLFGFMPSFNSGLLEQIRFAKQNFDFLELTLPYDLEQWSEEYVGNVKKNLGGFPLVGHVHWDIDLTTSKGIKKAKEAIVVFKKLKATKVVIHPSFPKDVDISESLSKNQKALKNLVDSCGALGVDLLIENGDPAIPDIVGKFQYFIDQIPGLNIALDIGHAMNNWKEFARTFKSKIKHLHLHYSDDGDDHLPFPDGVILSKIMGFWKNENMTGTLETFREKCDGILRKIEGLEREKVLLDQIEMINKGRV